MKTMKKDEKMFEVSGRAILRKVCGEKITD